MHLSAIDVHLVCTLYQSPILMAVSCAMVSSLDNTSTIQTHPTNIQYPPSRRAQYFLLHPILNQG
jgi:hypothetical protein